MLLYYITDRRQFAGDEARKRERLLATIAAGARCGLDYIQLRERDLPSRELLALARQAMLAVHEANASRQAQKPLVLTRLLVNSRTDVALAAGADGVHLPSHELPPSDARVVWQRVAGRSAGDESWNRHGGIIAASCHTVAEVRMAEAQGTDFAVFAPVFEKRLDPDPAQPNPAGLAALCQACAAVGAAPNVEGVGSGRMPVLALGGVTLENASVCMQAGAAGIAAIRLFQENDMAEVVNALRTTAIHSGA